jgi:hypothetical protein
LVGEDLKGSQVRYCSWSSALKTPGLHEVKKSGSIGGMGEFSMGGKRLLLNESNGVLFFNEEVFVDIIITVKMKNRPNNREDFAIGSHCINNSSLLDLSDDEWAINK